MFLINYINVSIGILLTNPFLYIAPISLVVVPLYQEALEIISLVRTKDIPLHSVPIYRFLPRMSPVSTHASICVNNYQCFVTPRFPSFELIILIYFLLVYFLSVRPIFSDVMFVRLLVCLLSYLSM